MYIKHLLYARHHSKPVLSVLCRTSLVAQTVKNPPAMPETQETQVQSLGGEDPLEKGMATHYSILARRLSWTGEPGGLQSMGLQRAGHNRANETWLSSQAPALRPGVKRPQATPISEPR